MAALPTRITTAFVALLVALSTVVAVPAHAAVPARTAAEQHAESVVFDLHNEARLAPPAFGHAALPVAPLAGWTDLREVARAWSDRQADELRMFHNPDFSSQICCWTRVGENVAYITLPGLDDATVEDASRRIFQAWMDSTGHRENILSGDYDQLGLGGSFAETATGHTMYLTANFRRTEGIPPGSEYTADGAADLLEPVLYDTPACPDGAYERGVFVDSVIGTHAGAIDCMLWWGVIRAGDADGALFGTGDAATRGFMAAVVDRLATAGESPLPTAPRDYFRDDDGHRYEAAINRVVAAGIAGGFTDGSFRPDATLTRAQMATFLARLYRDWLVLGDPRTSDHFRDDDTSPHEDNIDLVAGVGIARGTAPGRFSPNASLTRGQLATFAARTADQLALAGVGR